MDDLNYHYLNYFWHVVRAGTLAAAGRKLGLTQSTLSIQLKRLEQELGQPLFKKQGRGLVLTDLGERVYRYADQIFALGSALQEELRGQSSPGIVVLGVVMSLMPMWLGRFLRTWAAITPGVRFECVRGGPFELAARLQEQGLDGLVTDQPLESPAISPQRRRQLTSDSLVWMGTSDLVERLRPAYPASLDQAPLLVPTKRCALRGQIEGWLQGRHLHPVYELECDDVAVLREAGRQGSGLYPVPAGLVDDLARQDRTVSLGPIDDVIQEVWIMDAGRSEARSEMDALWSQLAAGALTF